MHDDILAALLDGAFIFDLQTKLASARPSPIVCLFDCAAPQRAA